MKHWHRKKPIEWSNEFQFFQQRQTSGKNLYHVYSVLKILYNSHLYSKFLRVYIFVDSWMDWMVQTKSIKDRRQFPRNQFRPKSPQGHHSTAQVRPSSCMWTWLYPTVENLATSKDHCLSISARFPWDRRFSGASSKRGTDVGKEFQ